MLNVSAVLLAVNVLFVIASETTGVGGCGLGWERNVWGGGIGVYFSKLAWDVLLRVKMVLVSGLLIKMAAMFDLFIVTSPLALWKKF